MTSLSLLFGLFRTFVFSRTALALENLALRQQLAALRRSPAKGGGATGISDVYVNSQRRP